jgi:glycosyltransferase involved in cell wall biosynthesis
MAARPFDFGNAKLSIVVPVFNEANRITSNLDLLIDEIEEYFPSFEIIVVSDGSTDGTNVRLLAFRHPGVKPIVMEKNSGKGNAVRAGFQRATGDYVLFIDGGMEIHPKEIRIFMGLMYLYDADIVIGSKRHPQSKVEYPLHRRILSWLFQRLVHLLFAVDVTDTQVGIKLLRKEVVDAILPDLEVNRYGFDLEMLSLAKIKGYANVLEAPIRMDYFGKNGRILPREFLHVARVSFSLLKDTLRLYSRLRKLRANTKPRVQSDSIKRVG